MRQKIGLIVPPTAGEVPPDASIIYPEIDFLSRGLGLRNMAALDYEKALLAIAGEAAQLMDAGVSAIGIMGTSLTFYQGAEYNSTLENTVVESTGLPCVTMSSSLSWALDALGRSRPLTISAYSQDVHEKLNSFLSEEGFYPVNGTNLEIVDIADLQAVTSLDLARTTYDAWLDSQGDVPDSIVISCGGLQTRGTIAVLEESLRVPVISSATSALWAVVSLLNEDPRRKGEGKLFDLRPLDKYTKPRVIH